MCQELPDTRRAGHSLRYRAADFIKCAFAVFFFQHQSLLDFQRHMKERLGRTSLETVFGVSEIPADTQIRTVLDRTEPEHLSPLFNAALRTADEAGLVEGYRVLDGGVLTVLDGVWYHSPENIRCGRCLHTAKDDITTYYHAAPSGATVKPGDTSVLPVMAEMTANGDGDKKQDCRLTAAKRRLNSHEPFCRQVLEAGYHFIFTYRDKTHQWLTETVKNSEPGERTKREWNRQHHLVYTCVLKNHGYNLEHNFGHGEARASGNFCVLNLPAFLFHTVLYLGDGVYRRTRER